MTYGDGVADVDITRSIAFHRQHGRLATLTAVQPAGRFGSLVIKDGAVLDFQEKLAGDGQWINGGFFVLSPKVGEYIAGDATPFEQESLKCWPAPASCAPSITTDSGSPWIPCAIRTTSKSSGPPATPPGRRGPRAGLINRF